jgi:PAS domain S-box-containing protein
MGFAATHSLAELLQKTLDEVGELTGSPIGFFHFVEADQKNLTLQAWSTRTLEEFCQTEGKGLHYSIGQAGVWADSVREQRAIIHNDYEALPHRKGFPEGHAQVVRELVVPILRNGRTVAILGIGNKSHDYTEQDAEFVSYIADLVWEITEQKRAAEALKQSELLLGNSQRIAHIGSWDMDTKTQQIIWTDEAYRIFGYRPQEFPVSLEFFINSLHPDDCSMVSDHFSEMLLTKQFREVDYRTVWPDGTMRWIHATGKVYTDENGEPVRIIGTVQDITERREAEKALHLTRFSVDNVADAVYWIDAESQITDANETASRMLGYTYEELMQMSLSDIDLDFSIERWAGIWQHLKDESKRTIEAQHRTKDDRIIPVEIVSNYIKFNGRELACAVVRDITERKQAEETLQKNEEHLRLITENMVDVISQTDAQINIIYSSPSLERVFGYLPEVIIGKPAMGMIHPDDVEPVLKLAVEARQRGEASVLLEYRWRHADGDYLWVESATRLLYDEHGESLGAIFGTRDITDRKRAEAEQMKLEEQLRQAQKLESIGRLAGGIAHDFNNLLVPMMGYTELGQMKLPADHSVNDYLQKIGLAAERAANLTRQILAFSRRQMLEIQLFDLNEIIIEFREMLHRLIGEDIELQLFLASSACLVKADQTQIEQILLNLCVNARDAMPNGGRLIIETDNIYLDEAYAESHLETQPGNYIMLSISDTGQGMDNETQKQIFEPFFTTKERGKGTGLGLATVFGVVKQHKGNIWVYSEPDKGTTFKIYLPRAKSNVQPDEISTSELPTIYGTETVMIAEDEPMVRKLAHETLEAYGYTVIETESVAEALDIAATYEDEIHLLLTDVIMPGMNGRELYEKLKKRRPDLIVLYMSGYTDNVIVHHGVLDEGVNFLQKPFTIRGLAKKVRSVLD